MFVSRQRLDLLCTASAASGQLWVEGGLLHAIRYTTATAEKFATGATVYITAAPLATGPTHDILKFTGTSAGAMLYPAVERCSTAGATAGLTALPIPIAREYIRVEVQGGGASGRGTFEFYLQGR